MTKKIVNIGRKMKGFSMITLVVVSVLFIVFPQLTNGASASSSNSNADIEILITSIIVIILGLAIYKAAKRR
jgi:heme/copper-type cytochrome/quinol oxidase subunit 2